MHRSEAVKATSTTFFTSSGPIHRSAALWSISAAVLVYIFITFKSWNWELDDALIYVRFVDNFLKGNGLVYNPGEYVNGLTSPLFTYLGIVAAAILGDARDGLMLVSAGSVLAVMLCCYRLLREIGITPVVATLPAWLIAVAVATFVNLGMEVGLFVLLFFESLRLYFRNAHFRLGIVLALLILARPEGVLLLPVLAINTLYHKRPLPGWRSFLLPSLLLSLQGLFNFIYYGSLLSTSSVAKIYQGESGYWLQEEFIGNLVRRFDLGFSVTGNWYLMGLFLLLAVAAPLHKPAREYIGVSGLFLLLYTLFFQLLKIPPQNWYYGIYFFILWTYVAIGVVALEGRWPGPANWLSRAPLPLLIVGSCLWQVPAVAKTFPGTVRPDYRDIGIWLANNTPAESSVAMVEIGTVGWYSQRAVIDILGLVSAGTADFIARNEFSGWTSLYRPDYMLVHEPIWELESGLNDLRGLATVNEVADFGFPGFRLFRIE